MITGLLTQVTRNARGLSARNETRVSGELIDIGRGALCRILLPDHRVQLKHAFIRKAQDGSLHIEAEGDALVSVNGFLERSAALNPGARVEIGPYRLTIQPTPADADVALVLEMPQLPADEALSAPSSPVTLAELGISKRRLGLSLAAVVLLVFLLLPLATRFSPGFEKWQAQLPLTLTGFISPGPLAAGHRVVGQQCSSCHKDAFQAVSDAACTECHQRMRTHRLITLKNLPGHALLDCHASHQGKTEATRHGSSNCIACHQTTTTPGAKVQDFARTHPSFHLSIPSGRELIRHEQTGAPLPAEDSGLKFSHALHLVKGGIKSPTGDTVLECRSCHVLESWRAFRPARHASIVSAVAMSQAAAQPSRQRRHRPSLGGGCHEHVAPRLHAATDRRPCFAVSGMREL
jgi:hypothetical protein